MPLQAPTAAPGEREYSEEQAETYLGEKFWKISPTSEWQQCSALER